MSYVVIVKTAKDNPPWKGLPDNYPVACQEFDHLADALAAFPDKQIMTIEEYKSFAADMHGKYPVPKPAEVKSKRWWQFWKKS